MWCNLKMKQICNLYQGFIFGFKRADCCVGMCVWKCDLKWIFFFCLNIALCRFSRTLCTTRHNPIFIIDTSQHRFLISLKMLFILCIFIHFFLNTFAKRIVCVCVCHMEKVKKKRGATNAIHIRISSFKILIIFVSASRQTVYVI